MKIAPLLEDEIDRKIILQLQQEAIDLFNDDVNISLDCVEPFHVYFLKIKGELLNFAFGFSASLLGKPLMNITLQPGSSGATSSTSIASNMHPDDATMSALLKSISQDKHFLGPVFKNVVGLIKAKGYECSAPKAVAHRLTLS